MPSTRRTSGSTSRGMAISKMTSATRLRSTAIRSASSRVSTTCGHPVALITMSACNMHCQRSARVAALAPRLSASSRARWGDWSMTTTEPAPFSIINRAEGFRSLAGAQQQDSPAFEGSKDLLAQIRGSSGKRDRILAQPGLTMHNFRQLDRLCPTQRSGMARMHRRCAPVSHASRTWMTIARSPTTSESSPAVTRNTCVRAASSSNRKKCSHSVSFRPCSVPRKCSSEFAASVGSLAQIRNSVRQGMERPRSPQCLPHCSGDAELRIAGSRR